MRQGQIKNSSIVCPRCGKTLDGWTHNENATPKPGDLAICLYCRAVNQYQADMTLQEAPAEVVAEVMLQLSQAQNMLKVMEITTLDKLND